MPHKKYFFLSTIVLFSVFILSFIGSILFGAQKISVNEIFVQGTFTNLILTKIRIPRTLLACFTGALLAGTGACFQMYFRNPITEPGIMGVSSGATLGAVIASCFFSGVFINIGAFLGAVAAGFLVLFLSGTITRKSSSVTILLCGTALSSIYSAFTAIILSLNNTHLQTMYMWMLGSFSGRGWKEINFILIPSAVSVIILFICSRPLDLLSGGETTASSLGVNINVLRNLIIIGGSLASSAAVCAGGTIGFVGLIAPHVCRKIFGSKARTLFPLSMICGASLLMISDTLCRSINPPAEIPVGTIMALVGGPFFISLIFTEKRK